MGRTRYTPTGYTPDTLKPEKYGSLASARADCTAEGQKALADTGISLLSPGDRLDTRERGTLVYVVGGDPIVQRIGKPTALALCLSDIGRKTLGQSEAVLVLVPLSAFLKLEC